MDNNPNEDDDYAEWSITMEAKIDRATKMAYTAIALGVGGVVIGVFSVKAIGKLGMALSNVAQVVQQIGGSVQPIVAGPADRPPQTFNEGQQLGHQLSKIADEGVDIGPIADPIEGPSSEPTDEQKAALAMEHDLNAIWNGDKDNVEGS